MSPTLEELLRTPLEGPFVPTTKLSLPLGTSAPTQCDWMRTEGFPQKVKPGPNSVAWRGEETKRWIDGPAHEDVE